VSKKEMSKFTRRQFTRTFGASGVMAASSIDVLTVLKRKSPQIVVVGGGFGGATAAKYLKRFNPSLDVTLVEPNRSYSTCPFSNTVIAGMNDISFITKSYNVIRGDGVNVVHDRAMDIDATKKQVALSNGKFLSFDRCVVSPGIDFKFDSIEGNSEAITQKIPHAWKAGVQTLILRKQLMAMPNGGVFLISPPSNPFRCPPGPAERISLVANYFTAHKPKSKIIALDPKKKFGKERLFKEGWEKLYPGMIEYRNIAEDGIVREVVEDKMMLVTDSDKVNGDVINLIPAQKAGAIAFKSGLTDKSGWCPVDQRTFESTIHKGVHVIGDASIASPMPKSGVSASSQGKVCAAAIVAMLKGDTPNTPKFINHCYSLLAPDYGISVAMVYGYNGKNITKIINSGGLSPLGRDVDFRNREALYADGWYQSFTQGIWG
jgi:sulfide dehydrogenase [flavocytochrome c] flavoprotein subunit